MILTVSGIAGEAGPLGPVKANESYNRGILLALAGIAAIIAVIGTAGLGWNLVQSNYVGVIVSALIGCIGVFLALGIVREFFALELLTKHIKELSVDSRRAVIAKMLEDNSKSVFGLVEALLRIAEKLLGGK
jgi:uncharacterized membrane protein YcjF (UPF0283 family)